ncbi:uroporphyrinogen-III synthase [Indiicoccus explosivorum]|uniref:uroporphyrinogen-III synthase n=1 Tax=Indiicoccus explosivorum TaxID=1917864 RepID=UPI000B43FD1C|nr:uroporphyrinogen-III synthase [Indiicoccus explosivorum]
MTSTTDRPLAGETVVFTGSSYPEEAAALAERCGAETLYIPLIRTVPTGAEAPDLSRYDWLIFTSSSAVRTFLTYGIKPEARFAAVGSKTAEALEAGGFQVDFVPSVYSADYFAEEFPKAAGDRRCLFIRGVRAKDTIADMPMPVDEWTVYDTVPDHGNAVRLAKMEGVTVIFASPSAVETFAAAGGRWEAIKAAAIGYVTEQAVREAGGRVIAAPERHTYEEVIEILVKGRTQHD